MESFEYPGFWWVSGASHHKVAGIISFSQDNCISLELIGKLEFVNNRDIILGTTHKGIFSLLDCTILVNTSSLQGVNTQSYRAKIAFLDHHFNNLDEVKFSKLQVSFTHLNSFANCLENTQNEIKSSITYADISIIPLTNKHINNHQIIFEKNTLIELQLKQEVSFDEVIQKFVNPIGNFISLATDRANAVTKLYLWIESRKDDPIGLEAIFVDQTVNMTNDKKLHSDDLLFNLDDIKQCFRLGMQFWFNFHDKMDDIINLYFSTVYNNNLYIENKFLSLVQVLESFHRRKFDKVKYLTKEHEEKLDYIIEATPTEYKDWLKETLKHSHEPSLDQRLQALLKITRETMIPIIAKPEEFFRSVKYTRNYRTHYDDSLKNKSLSGDELARATQILDFMVKACLLSELNCTSERCEQLLSRSRKYQYLKQLASTARV